MNPNSFCEHLTNLKSEKVANFITKSRQKCMGNKRHASPDYSLCLHCGDTHCHGEPYKCSYQHFYAKRHCVVLEITPQTFYCFICEQTILPPAQEDSSKKKQKSVEMLERFYSYLGKQPRRDEKEQANEVGVKPVKNKSTQHQSEVGNLLRELRISQKQKQLHVFGLSNLGNTCFFNATIQCLYATESLHRNYEELPAEHEGINFQFKKYLQNKDRCFNPKALFSAICKTRHVYQRMDQQDAQELLGALLNMLADGEKKILKTKERTITDRVFGFYLASRLHCCSCSTTSWSVDFAFDLAVELARTHRSVELPPTEEIPQEIGRDLRMPNGESSGGVLDHFFSAEAFTKNNYFKCEKCSASNAIRKFYIKDPPDSLIVALKRFSNDGSKNNASVKMLEGNFVYELYGVVVHGGTSGGGHYVAYTRREEIWFYFSDSSVKELSWEKVRVCQPYLMFYRRLQ